MGYANIFQEWQCIPLQVISVLLQKPQNSKVIITPNSCSHQTPQSANGLLHTVSVIIKDTGLIFNFNS